MILVIYVSFLKKFLFVIFPIIVIAQPVTRKTLNGKVVADLKNLEGIYVINVNTERGMTTENGGYFLVQAQPGDTIMLSSIQFKATKIIVSNDDFCKDLLFVRMKPTVIQLDEVKVLQYKNINAVALGIIPKGQRTYTPAERRLRTATGIDARIGLNTSVTIDPIFNFFSGRTAELLKILK